MLNAYQHSPTYVGFIIGYCISFNGCFRSLIFLYVRSEVNQAPRYLAKYVIRNLDYISIKETPPYIYAVLTFDLLLNFRQ